MRFSSPGGSSIIKALIKRLGVTEVTLTEKELQNANDKGMIVSRTDDNSLVIEYKP